MANKEIRQAIGAKCLKQYEVAKALNMKDSNFSRMLREELPEDEKQKILAVINAMGEGE